MLPGALPRGSGAGEMGVRPTPLDMAVGTWDTGGTVGGGGGGGRFTGFTPRDLLPPRPFLDVVVFVTTEETLE